MQVRIITYKYHILRLANNVKRYLIWTISTLVHVLLLFGYLLLLLGGVTELLMFNDLLSIKLVCYKLVDTP